MTGGGLSLTCNAAALLWFASFMTIGMGTLMTLLVLHKEHETKDLEIRDRDLPDMIFTAHLARILLMVGFACGATLGLLWPAEGQCDEPSTATASDHS